MNASPRFERSRRDAREREARSKPAQQTPLASDKTIQQASSLSSIISRRSKNIRPPFVSSADSSKPDDRPTLIGSLVGLARGAVV